MKKALILVFFWSCCYGGFSQTKLRGSVLEEKTKDKLSNVFVYNTKTAKGTHTDKNGAFELFAALNDILIFSCPGYVSDTLLLTSHKPLTVYLPILGIQLSQVTVRGTAVFDPKKEYPQVYRRSTYATTARGGGLALSPSRMFGKEARYARRFKKMLKREAEEREIDRVFSVQLITSMLPLRGVELDNFMLSYRPDLRFVRRSSKEAMQSYIIDSYKEFKKMPEEKRRKHPLSLLQNPREL